MLTSLSFLSAERKSAPDYSPETQEQPVALLAQPASNERPLLEGEPLSLYSDLLRFSVTIPTVSSEGQKLKIFRDTPRRLCRRFLLFTEVRGSLRMRTSSTELMLIGQSVEKRNGTEQLTVSTFRCSVERGGAVVLLGAAAPSPASASRARFLRTPLAASRSARRR